jgi:hypothetical protein
MQVIDRFHSHYCIAAFIAMPQVRGGGGAESTPSVILLAGADLPSLLAAPVRRSTMVFVVIGSFAVIFLICILWATSRRAGEGHH